jgi:uncharacterized protein YjiS (DUF1127 family)
MSFSTHSDQTFAGASFWQILLTTTANLTHRRAQHRAYRSTVRELAMLSDRELADAGLHRGDIRDIAREAAYAA